MLEMMTKVIYYISIITKVSKHVHFVFDFLVGVFGEIRYSISGEQVELFTMDVITGELKVASGAVIDREVMDDIWLQAMAVDNAPVAARKTATVAVSS